MTIKPETMRRAQLFRLLEGAIRATRPTAHIRDELIEHGVTGEEIFAFKISVRKLIRSERKRRGHRA
jgi:hypothetical protein